MRREEMKLPKTATTSDTVFGSSQQCCTHCITYTRDFGDFGIDGQVGLPCKEMDPDVMLDDGENDGVASHGLAQNEFPQAVGSLVIVVYQTDKPPVA